jgi:phage-related protein
MWYIDQKTFEDREIVEFELALSLRSDGGYATQPPDRQKLMPVEVSKR